MVEVVNLNAMLSDKGPKLDPAVATDGNNLNLLHLVGSRTEGGTGTPTPQPIDITNNANATAGAKAIAGSRSEATGGNANATGGNATADQSLTDKTTNYGGVALGANSWALPQCGTGWGAGVASFFAGLNFSKTDMNAVCQLNNNANVDSEAGLKSLSLLVHKLEDSHISSKKFDDKMNLLLAKFGAKMLSEAVTQADEGRQLLEQQTGVHSDIAADLPQFDDTDVKGPSKIYGHLKAHGVPNAHHFKTVCINGHYKRVPAE